ncbi:hypothetical protein ACFE04_027918 [Oxalis oulophora]
METDKKVEDEQIANNDLAATGGIPGMVLGQYRKIREHAETYPYVWGSYIVVYGGLGLWFTYRWRKLRKMEDRVRALQLKLPQVLRERAAAAAMSAQKGVPSTTSTTATSVKMPSSNAAVSSAGKTSTQKLFRVDSGEFSIYEPLHCNLHGNYFEALFTGALVFFLSLQKPRYLSTDSAYLDDGEILSRSIRYLITRDPWTGGTGFQLCPSLSWTYSPPMPFWRTIVSVDTSECCRTPMDQLQTLLFEYALCKEASIRNRAVNALTTSLQVITD